MLVRARRPTASLCIALLALNQVACIRIRQEEPQTVLQSTGGSVPMENVVGVTLKDGRDIRFDKNSHPIVRRDTLKVDVGNQLLTIPVSDVQRVWVLSINRTATDLVVFGVVVLALALAAVIAALQGFGHGP